MVKTMLSELYINNLAVIEKTSVSFGPGLNVFTGETGAGKSIVIDAINAILGQRTSKEIVRTGEEKAVVHAVFTDLSAALLQKLAEYGCEAEDGELLIQREITADGKSSARICGRPVTAAILRELGGELINIHGQHDNQVLLQPERHLHILDAFGDLKEPLAVYQDSYRKLLKIHREIKQIDTDEAEKARKIDLLSYQTEEIADAAPEPGEDERLENEKKAIQNYSQILDHLQSAYHNLFGDEERGSVDSVLEASSDLEAAAEFDARIAAVSERLTDLSYQLEDTAQEVSAILQEMDYDPGQLEAIEERLDLLNQLKRKYGGTLEEVICFRQKAEAELEQIELSDERLAELQRQEDEALKQTRQLAVLLTEQRRKAAERLTERITEELRFLDMPNVRLEVTFGQDKLRQGGRDIVEFFISTNPGEPPKPISRIASGGELSRIMLAIKNALAEKDDVPTLIFDEVDTGVSGRAAQKIGLKLKSVAKHRQIICVTHLAQIAALADTHFLIRKEFTPEKTFTKVHQLDFEGRKQEIARIIGTDQITELTLKNAEEMLKQGEAV